MNPHVGALSWQAAEGAPQCLPTQRRANPTRKDAPRDAAPLGSLRHAPRAGARRGQPAEPGTGSSSGAPAAPHAPARPAPHAPARAAPDAPARRAGAHLKTRARAHAAADARAVFLRAHDVSALDAPDAAPDLRAHDAGADARDALPDHETDAVLQRNCRCFHGIAAQRHLHVHGGRLRQRTPRPRDL